MFKYCFRLEQWDGYDVHELIAEVSVNARSLAVAFEDKTVVSLLFRATKFQEEMGPSPSGLGWAGSYKIAITEEKV